MAFHDFMVRAVASRPVEQFETKVTLPNWQVEGGEEAWTGEPDDYMLVDQDGNPLPEGSAPPRRDQIAPPDGAAPPAEQPREPAEGEQLNEEWLDRVTRRPPPPPREPPPDPQGGEL